jgi:hypothetical protein
MDPIMQSPLVRFGLYSRKFSWLLSLQHHLHENMTSFFRWLHASSVVNCGPFCSHHGAGDFLVFKAILDDFGTN